jgi:hypothetical protein
MYVYIYIRVDTYKALYSIYCDEHSLLYIYIYIYIYIYVLIHIKRCMQYIVLGIVLNAKCFVNVKCIVTT